MNIKLRWMVAAEAVIIMLLLAVIINYYTSNSKIEKARNNGLLSPRITSGLLEPKSFMIVNFAPLREKMRNYIEKNNLNVSVYVENLRNGAFTGINEKTGFFPTSLNKLPVAILTMKKIEEGELSFDTMLDIKDIDRTDSSGELYKTNEKQVSVRTLLEKLLRESDNTALRVLLRSMSLDDLQLVLDYYGIDINVNQQSRNKNSPDLITPKSMSNLFSSLYFSTVLEPKSSEYLLSLLTKNNFDIKKIADLPDDVTVAQKFGENYYGNNRFFHSCGIMYIDETRVFYCIMTKDLDEETAVETISVIANEIYKYAKETKAKLAVYKE